MISRNLLNPITAYKRKTAVKSCTDDHLSRTNQIRPKRVVQSSILDEINKRYPQTVRVRQVPNIKHDRIATFRFPTDPDDLKAHFTQTPPSKPRHHDVNNITDSFRYKSEDIAFDFTTAAQSTSKARRKSDASTYNGGLSPMEKKIGTLLHESISKRFEKPVRIKSAVKESNNNKLAQSGSRIRLALRKALLVKQKTKTEPDEKQKATIQLKKEIKEQSRSLTSIDQNTKSNSLGRLDTSEDLIALAETLNANDSFREKGLMDRVDKVKFQNDEGRESTRSDLSNKSKSKSKLNGSKLKKRSSATPSYKDIFEFKNKAVIKISGQYYKAVPTEAKTERAKKIVPEFTKSPLAIDNNFDQIMREFKGNNAMNKENNYHEREAVVGSLAYLAENEYNGLLPVIEEEERMSKKRRNKSTGREKKLVKHKNTMSMNFMPVYGSKKTVILPALGSASKEREKEKRSARKNIRETLNTDMALRDKDVTSLHNLMLTEDDYETARDEKKKNTLMREFLKPKVNKFQVMTPSPRMFTGSGFIVGTSAF